MKNNDFTSGAILPLLLKFMLPVLFAMFLQAMYGAVDLLVVGQFSTNADVSGVSTGSQIILTLTNLIVSFAMGITVAVGQKIGQKRPDEAAQAIGTGLLIFAAIGAVFTIISVAAAAPLAKLMHAPEEAFDITVNYIRICGGGFIVITAYNLLGSIFRGLGDSKTPLIAVGIACFFNIIGNLVFVAVLHMGASGAALATVIAQFISVVISLIIIRKVKLPFQFSRSDIKFNPSFAGKIVKIGAPIALQDFLVGISFLVLLAIVNQLGLTQSAGIGVAEGICGAFCVRIPVALLMQQFGNGSLFLIGLATPCSTVLQIIMCFIAFFCFKKKQKTMV